MTVNPRNGDHAVQTTTMRIAIEKARHNQPLSETEMLLLRIYIALVWLTV